MTGPSTIAGVRRLGATGVELPAVGFGCAAGSVVLDSDDAGTRRAVLGAALRAGFGYLDTASAYGDGDSETRVGAALMELVGPGYPGGPVRLGTKVALRWADLADPRSAVLRHVEDSLERLGTDRLTLLTLHNRTFLEPGVDDFAVGAQLSLHQVLGPGGVAAAFAELREQGVVEAVGFTTLGGDAAAHRELIGSGAFGFVNASLNLLNPSAVRPAGPGFPDVDRGGPAATATAAGMGVLAVHVLGKGRLAGSGARDPRTTRVLAAAGAGPDTDPAALALRYVLSRPEITCAVLGLATTGHVAAAVAALDAGPLDPAVLDVVERAALAPDPHPGA